jgi:hypothetical protein
MVTVEEEGIGGGVDGRGGGWRGGGGGGGGGEVKAREWRRGGRELGGERLPSSLGPVAPTPQPTPTDTWVGAGLDSSLARMEDERLTQLFPYHNFLATNYVNLQKLNLPILKTRAPLQYLRTMKLTT